MICNCLFIVEDRPKQSGSISLSGPQVSRVNSKSKSSEQDSTGEADVESIYFKVLGVPRRARACVREHGCTRPPARPLWSAGSRSPLLELLHLSLRDQRQCVLASVLGSIMRGDDRLREN